MDPLAVRPEPEDRGRMAAGHPSSPTSMNLVRDVKTFGAGESPKGRTQKRKSLPFHPKHMNFLMEAHEAYEAPEAEAHEAEAHEHLKHMKHLMEAHEAPDGST
jgi:hypothetical protein